jgi:hypothetical protein
VRVLEAISLAVFSVTASASCPATVAKNAQAHYEAIDYQAAIVAVGELDRCADGSPDELADALRWRAQAFAAGGKTEEAIDGFALVDTVSSSYRLGPEVSPKVQELFEAGRQRARTRGLVFARIRKATRGDKGGSVDIELFDPLHATSGVRAVLESSGDEVKARPVSGRMWTAELPVGAKGTVSVLVLGPTGARYRSGAVPIVSLVPDEKREPIVAEVKGSSSGLTTTHFIIGGIVLAALIGASILLGVVIHNANQPECGTLGCVMVMNPPMP